jgi:hypothetical protein
MKWYPADWRSEPRLKLVTRPARSLWIDMLGLMHEAEPYGHLLIDGTAPTVKNLAAIFGDKEIEIFNMLAQLKKANVFSTTEGGVIFSRRMVRDKEKAEKDRLNGKVGGNPRLKGGVNPPDKPPNNRQDKPPVNGGDKAQKPETRSQRPEENPERPVAASPLAALMSQVWKALNVNDASGLPPNLSHRMREIVEGLLAENCDFHSDIAPALALRPEGQLWPQSPAYWLKIARANRDKRVAANTSKAGSTTVPFVELSEWQRRMRVWWDHTKWDRRAQPEGWGPAPGEPGCVVPEKLLDRWAA